MAKKFSELRKKMSPAAQIQAEAETRKMLNDIVRFKSGATSSSQVLPYDLIPMIFLQRLAERFKLGAEKHGRFNYRKGLRDKEFIQDRLNHAFEHLKNAMDQIEIGLIFGDDDLAAVLVNVAMAMEYQEENGLTPYANNRTAQK